MTCSSLKGTSNHFDVVTRFDMSTFLQGRVWDGDINYESSAYSQIIQAFYNFATSPSSDEHAHLIMGTSWSAGRELGVSSIYHCIPEAAPPSLAPFAASQLQIFNSLREDSLLGFTKEQPASSTDGARQLYFTTSFRLDPQLMSDVRKLWLEVLELIMPVTGVVLAFVF